jgi:phasin family protein
VAEANRVAVEGLQALARRQVEVLQESMKEASEAVSSLRKAGSPAELAATEAELGKSAFEKSVATMREMAEILVKSSQEATDKINARIAATLEEIRSLGSSTK